MKPNKILILLLAIIVFGACHTPSVEEEQWESLFNGKDLTGWTPKIAGYKVGDNYGNTFRVEDGLLKVSYSEYDTFETRFGHLFYEKPYSNYKLRVEYRFVGEQMPGVGSWAYKNNGVMFHSQSAESMNLDQGFPVSLEAQFLGGNDTISNRPTGNLCTPGLHVMLDDTLLTDHCLNSSSKTVKGEEWVTFELVVEGDEIMHHIVDGDTVMTYSKPVVGGDFLPKNYPIEVGTPVKSGYFALQSESHPIEFRKVEILDLSVYED